MKWTRYAEDVLPLWVAESDFATCPQIKAELEQAVAKERFGYQPDCHRLEEATANFYRSHYGFDAKASWIFPLPDVVRGLFISICHFTTPGSKVIVPTPAYPPFFELLKATGREGIFIDANGGIDETEVERGFADGAGCMLLCSPHNPLGYTFTKEQLASLASIAHRYGGRLLVDEIHAPLVYDGRHVVAASVSPEAAETCITVTATSKAWNTAGLKCAQIIFSNEEDVRRWKALSPIVKDGVSTIGLLAAAAAYESGEEFLADELAVLRSNRDLLVAELPKRVPGLKTSQPEATYLLWLDFSETPLAAQGSPAAFLLEHAKVALNDGAFFGNPACARLNFATSPEILHEALTRIERAVNAVSSVGHAGA